MAITQKSSFAPLEKGPARSFELKLPSTNVVNAPINASELPCNLNVVLMYHEPKTHKYYALGNMQYNIESREGAIESVLERKLWRFRPQSQAYERHPVTIIGFKTPGGISSSELDITSMTSGTSRARWGSWFTSPPVKSTCGVPSSHWNPSTLSCWVPIDGGYRVDRERAYAGSDTSQEFLEKTVDANMTRAFDLLGALPAVRRDFNNLDDVEKRIVLAMTIQGVFPYYVGETTLMPRFFSKAKPGGGTAISVDPRDRSQLTRGTNGDCDDAMLETFLFCTSLFQISAPSSDTNAGKLITYMKLNYCEPIMVIGMARSPQSDPHSTPFCHAYSCLATTEFINKLDTEDHESTSRRADKGLEDIFRLIPSEKMPVPHIDRGSEPGYTTFTTQVDNLSLKPLVVPSADAAAKRAEEPTHSLLGPEDLPVGKPLLIEATAPTVPDEMKYITDETHRKFPGIRTRLVYNALLQCARDTLKEADNTSVRNVFCGARVTENWNYDRCFYCVSGDRTWHVSKDCLLF